MPHAEAYFRKGSCCNVTGYLGPGVVRLCMKEVIDSIKTIPSSFFTYIGTQEEGNTTDKRGFVVDLNFHFARFGVQYSIFTGSDGNLNHSKSHWIPPQTVLSFCVRSLNILLLLPLVALEMSRDVRRLEYYIYATLAPYQ